VFSFGVDHGGEGGDGMFFLAGSTTAEVGTTSTLYLFFFGGEHDGGGADGMYIYVAGNTAVKVGMAYFLLAMSAVAEAGTVCIFGREHGGTGEDGMNFFGKTGGFCFWQRYGGG
jgi:hypothetical protein